MIVREETIELLFEAQKQAVLDHNSSTPNLLEKVPQELIELIRSNTIHTEDSKDNSWI